MGLSTARGEGTKQGEVQSPSFNRHQAFRQLCLGFLSSLRGQQPVPPRGTLPGSRERLPVGAGCCTASPRCAGTDGQEPPARRARASPRRRPPGGAGRGGAASAAEQGAPTAQVGPRGPLTFSCRAARSSLSSCPCFSCDWARAALCSSESSFRASCSWTKWLAISRSCEGKNPSSQRRVRECPGCPGLGSAPFSRAPSTAASADILTPLHLQHRRQATPPSPYFPLRIRTWSPKQAPSLGQGHTRPAAEP